MVVWERVWVALVHLAGAAAGGQQLVVQVAPLGSHGAALQLLRDGRSQRLRGMDRQTHVLAWGPMTAGEVTILQGSRAWSVPW